MIAVDVREIRISDAECWSVPSRLFKQIRRLQALGDPQVSLLSPSGVRHQPVLETSRLPIPPWEGENVPSVASRAWLSITWAILK